MTTLYRLYNTETTNHLYTSDLNEVAHLRLTDNWQFEGAKLEVRPGSIDVHRFFNTETGVHLLTCDPLEIANIRDNLPAWNDEGVAFTTDSSTGVASYQHENGSFFYTADIEEVEFINANLPHLTVNGSRFGAQQSDDSNSYIIETGNDNDVIDNTSIIQSVIDPLNNETLILSGEGKDNFTFSVYGSSSFTGPDYGNFVLGDFDVLNDTLTIISPDNEPFAWDDPALQINEISSENGDYTQINIQYTDPNTLFLSTGTINIHGVDNQAFYDFIA